MTFERAVDHLVFDQRNTRDSRVVSFAALGGAPSVPVACFMAQTSREIWNMGSFSKNVSRTLIPLSLALTVVACVPEATDVLLRTRRLRRPFLIANGTQRPLTESWNEAVVRWQPNAHRSQSAYRARA